MTFPWEQPNRQREIHRPLVDRTLVRKIKDMMFPVKCHHCRAVYDVANVKVTGRWTDCSAWNSPCCGYPVDDRRQPWGTQHYTELNKDGSAKR